MAAPLSSPAFAEGGNLVKDADGYYLIDDAYDLAKFRDGVNGDAIDADGNPIGNNSNARLTADIDLSSIKNWEPIGTDESTEFYGVFDGCGHTISNLTVEAETYAGLFGHLNGGTIRNLTINNADVRATGGGDTCAGGIFASADYADSESGSDLYSNLVLSNCAVTGTVNITAAYAGGIAGSAIYLNGDASNCIVDASGGTISGSEFAGGLFGHVMSGLQLTNCLYIGRTGSDIEATGSNEPGAIAGSTPKNSSFGNNAWFVPEGSDVTNGIGDGNGEYIAMRLTSEPNSQNIVTGLKLTAPSDDTLTVGGTYTFTLATAPGSVEGAFGTGSFVSSADVSLSPDSEEGIIEIQKDTFASDGRFTITGQKAGEAAITVTASFMPMDYEQFANDGTVVPRADGTPTDYTFTAKVTFSEAKPESIFFKAGETYEMKTGETAELEIGCTPEDAPLPALTWSSSNPDVASVDGNTGEITALSAGESVITAASVENPDIKAECTLTVLPDEQTTPDTPDEDDPTVPDNPENPDKPQQSGGGGGGGCSAGFGALALLAALPLMLKRRK